MRGRRPQIAEENDSEGSEVEFLGTGYEGFKKMVIGERERSRDEERMTRMPRARKTKKNVDFL